MATKTGGSGKDTLDGTILADTLKGLDGNDSLIGKAGDDLLQGGNDNDHLDGGVGDDTLQGGGGDDFIEGGFTVGFDRVDGGTGDDILAITVSAGALVGVNAVAGGEGFDELQVTDVSLVLGNTLYDLANGRIDFGLREVPMTGIERLFLSTLSGLSKIEVNGSSDDDDVELATTSAIGAAKAFGNDGNDSLLTSSGGVDLFGGNGDDLVGALTFTNQLLRLSLSGGAGDDTLIPGGGNDRVDGGAGSDIVDYSASGNAPITLRLNSSPAILTTDNPLAKGDSLIGIEGALGGNGGDTLVGSSVANTLFGEGGNDTLDGGAAGDLLDGGGGIDTASYASAAAAVIVNLNAGLGSTGVAQGDQLRSIERLIGSAFADRLAGNPQANQLDGGNGDDNLAGGTGADTYVRSGGKDLIAESGLDLADKIVSGPVVLTDSARVGNDLILSFGDGSQITIRNQFDGGVVETLEIRGVKPLVLATTMTGGSVAGIISGTAAGETLDGGGGDDLLFGGAGRDRLIGGTGNDRLDGGSGPDRLEGGSGGDRFVFDDGDSGVGARSDTVADFAWNDLLDLSRVDAVRGLAGDQAFAWIGSRAFTAAGQLRFGVSGDDRIVLGNIDGDLDAELRIVLEDHAVRVYASDLVL
ncbi:MAG: calcium-binding protein [Geminicoccaceae bacterium]